MLHNLTGWHALIILAIVILVFGATKLPALAKSLGQSVRILKDETAEKRPSGPDDRNPERSEEHTSELQSRGHLVCRLLLEKKKVKQTSTSMERIMPPAAP